jgi:hypothetical protein
MVDLALLHPIYYNIANRDYLGFPCGCIAWQARKTNRPAAWRFIFKLANVPYKDCRVILCCKKPLMNIIREYD